MIPESTSVVFRPDLSAQVQEYDAKKAAKKFIGRRAAPIFLSAVDTGQYPIINRETYKKPVSTARASGGKYNRIGGKFGKGTFTCEENGLEYPIDDRNRKKYARLFDAEAAASEVLWFQQLLAHERRVASLFANGGWTNHNVGTAWSTVATATPLNDIASGIHALEDNSGVSSEDITMIIPRADWREFLSTTQVVDKMKYTFSANEGVQPSEISPKVAAQMLQLKDVLVARSSYDSKEEGVTESMSQVWTAGVIYLAVLCDEGDPLEAVSAARTILWEADSPELPVMESYREENIRSDIVRSRMDTDEVLIGDTDLFVYKLTNT